MERNIYLSNTDLDVALKHYMEKLHELNIQSKVEIIKTWDGNKRVLSRPIFAKLSSPNHNAAAMDGIMVVSEKTYAANEVNTIKLTRGVDFEYINTGHLILDPYDAVIMIEDILAIDDHYVGINVQASPWQHIRPIGEDVVAGEMILPENHTIRPIDIGAILSGGVAEIEVFQKLKVAIIPTGNEITDNYADLPLGKTFDTNSWTFKAILEDFGAIPIRVSPVPDVYEILKEEILEQVESCDMIVINAGSSAGSKDYTKQLIVDLGEVFLHGIAIKPGKPTILGVIQGKPVIGVPGYPGSAFLVFEEVVGPIIKLLQKQEIKDRETIKAILSKRVVSSLKNKEYIRVKLGRVNGVMVATPLNKGAGVTMAIVKSDGIFIVPKNSEGFEAGEQVDIILTSDIGMIENTLVSIGSHDIIMDLIGSLMAKKSMDDTGKSMYLSSAHIGSMGGIMALKRGETHIAPIHLLDEVTGEYNVSYVKKYLGDEFGIIKGVRREQGIITAKGNPKSIKAISDIARKGIHFVNRQKGSGTRILTDYLLGKEGIDPNLINGYEREFTTHMGVAAAVKSGTADVGIGVYSAAAALDLEFYLIGYEDYDFAISKALFEDEKVKEFIKILRGNDLKEQLEEIGGYEIIQEEQ